MAGCIETEMAKTAGKKGSNSSNGKRNRAAKLPITARVPRIQSQSPYNTNPFLLKYMTILKKCQGSVRAYDDSVQAIPYVILCL